jgi:hypothetical protein
MLKHADFDASANIGTFKCAPVERAAKQINARIIFRLIGRNRWERTTLQSWVGGYVDAQIYAIAAVFALVSFI